MANMSQASQANISCLCQSSTTWLVLPTFYGLIFLTGLPGNALALWIFVRKISTKTPTHVYLINLGVSNLMLCLTMPFLAAYYALGADWRARQPACQLAICGLTPVLHSNICISMVILTWVALSRFATLVQHSHSPRPSRCARLMPTAFLRNLRHARFAWAACLATWVCVAITVVPTVVLYSTRETEGGAEAACYSMAVEVGGGRSQASSALGIAFFFLCFLLVLSLYTATTRHICRSRRSAAVSDSQRVYSRVFRNIVVIQLVLAFCLLPHHIFKAAFINMAHQHSLSGPTAGGCHPLSVYVEVKNVLLCLATLRCSTDPVMYFLLDRTFHKHTVTLLGWGHSTQSSQSSASILDCGQTSQACVVTDTVVCLHVHSDASQLLNIRPTIVAHPRPQEKYETAQL